MIRIWTVERLKLVVKLRDVDGLAWSMIGERFGVKGPICCARYHAYKAELRIAERRKALGLVDPQPKNPARVERPSILPTINPEKRPRYFHSDDMDVLGRVERQGLTAGFLGDPPPGRSALDKRGRSA